MIPFMNITKALADENRIRILLALDHHGETCVCHLIDLLQLAPSTVSKHLFLLKNARLIIARKEGRWVYYRLSGIHDAPQTVVDALRWVTRSVADDPAIEADRRRLDRIPALSAADGCTAQAGTP